MDEPNDVFVVSNEFGHLFDKPERVLETKKMLNNLIYFQFLLKFCIQMCSQINVLFRKLSTDLYR